MLLKLSLTISLIGIVILLILANTLEPNLQSIKNITIKDLNKKVKIQGEITTIKDYDTFQVLTISDSTGKIKAILNQPIDLKNGQNLIIIGRITQYKNNLQIQIEKVILIK